MNPQDFLKDIVEHKKKANADKRVFFDRLITQIQGTDFNRYAVFQKAISAPGKIHLIAEIKKASPSKGLLREEFDVKALAEVYEKSGASALSVLTEEKFFLGKPEYIKRISHDCRLPILTKDFIIEDGQLYEAKFNGASAVLLIVAILPPKELKRLIAKAEELDLDCLVEVHDEKELDAALSCGATIIGINNRNLHTFEVCLDVSEKLIPKIPKGKVIVVESGIQSRQDVLKFKELGAHAVLIGETFMREQNIEKKVKELMDG